MLWFGKVDHPDAARKGCRIARKSKGRFMMAVQTRRMTVEEFDRFVTLPENAHRLFELIGGEVVEVVSNQRSSAIAYRLGGLLSLYVTNNGAGFLTGADSGYIIAGERYIPSIAFVSKDRQAEPSDESYSRTAPDLAVEVLSPSNSSHDMRGKIANYITAGTAVWVVDPDRKVVEIYTPGQPVCKIGVDDVLDGGSVLPGFTVEVKNIFQA